MIGKTSDFSWRQLPWGVVLIVVALSAISVINLQSTVIGTDSRIYITQLVWLAAGLGVDVRRCAS